MIPYAKLAACALAGSLADVPAAALPAASPPAASAAAPAAPSPATAASVSLRDAFDAAWQRAVSARDADGQRRRADAERSVAGRPWAAAPTLELGHRADRPPGRGGGRETEVGIAVPLWLPGQKAARLDAADAAVAQAQAAEPVARLRLAGELREAAWQLAALQAEVRQAEAQALALQQLAADVERRVGAGDLARADSLAAQAEQLAATAALADARQRLRAAKAPWALLTGLTALPDLATSTAAAMTAAGAATGTETARHPEQQLASQTTALARQRLELMRHSRRDAPELTVAVRQDTPGRGEASQGSVIVGLRLPFGTDDRNRPLEAAALAELDIAQTQEQRLRERLDSEAAVAREALHAAQAQQDAEHQRARLLRERATLIDQSFRAGETPLPDLLRALAAAAQADSALARQTAALGLARARLEQALGLLP